MAERVGFVRLRATRFGEISFLSASHRAVARNAIQSEQRQMAERVGFVHLRASRYGGSHHASEPSFAVGGVSSLAYHP
jgi:hypothetical protein